MKISNELFKNHRFPAEIIQYAVWLYFVFPLSFRDVELLLHQRGIVVCDVLRSSARTRSDIGRSECGIFSNTAIKCGEDKHGKRS